jgi:hypothetical protein
MKHGNANKSKQKLSMHVITFENTGFLNNSHRKSKKGHEIDRFMAIKMCGCNNARDPVC